MFNKKNYMDTSNYNSAVRHSSKSDLQGVNERDADKGAYNNTVAERLPRSNFQYCRLNYGNPKRALCLILQRTTVLSSQYLIIPNGNDVGRLRLLYTMHSK